ncbi:MAG: BON domain-containing protein [Burkholderiaceae bacterium]
MNLHWLRVRGANNTGQAHRVVGSVALATITGMAGVGYAQERANYFNDPFLQITNGLAACTVPEGPSLTRDEVRVQSHLRSEHGTRCYLSGRCRLPNSYLYDQEIISRVKKAIDTDGRFADTSVWAEGQRRWVTLKGCVRSKSESEALVQLARSIDDVVMVVNELVVGMDHSGRAKTAERRSQ